METRPTHGKHGEIPKPNKTGMYKKINFNSGISATLMDYNFFNSITSKVATSRAALGFGFCLSGKTKTRIQCLRDEFVIQGGQSAFYYLPDIKIKSEDSSTERVKRMSIEMPIETFQEFIAEEPDAVPREIRVLAEGNKPEPFRTVDKLTPWMRKTLTQIFNCPYEGLPGRFFTEAKLMELMAYKLDHMIKHPKKPKVIVKLKKEDVERLHFARELLINNLEQPMGLVELSRIVGISRTKLLNGFDSVFGTSPTSYLRNMRVEKARHLIDQGHMSLTEIAHSVGYSSSSHFTKVFKNYFSVTPSQYVLKRTG